MVTYSEAWFYGYDLSMTFESSKCSLYMLKQTTPQFLQSPLTMVKQPEQNTEMSHNTGPL